MDAGKRWKAGSGGRGRAASAGKRLLSLFMAAVLAMSLLPGAALAAETDSVTVRFSAQSDNSFLVPMREITVSDGLAEQYGYTVAEKDHNNEAVNAPTVFDALVAVHAAVYGEDFTKETAAGYLAISNGTLRTAFQKSATSTSFFVNGEMPNDGIEADYGATGYMADTARLEEGDTVEFWFYQDDYWMDYYSFFQDGTVTAETGAPVQLALKGFMAMSAMGSEPTAEAISGDITIHTVGAGGTLSEPLKSGDGTNITPDENGIVTLTFSEAGVYHVTAKGTCGEYDAPIVMPWCTVAVEEAAETPAAPTSIEIKYDGTQVVPGTTTLIGKEGDTFQFRAYDQNGEETPVTWSVKYSGSIDGNGLYTAGTLSAGGTSTLYVTATSTLDTSVKQEARFSLTGYAFSTYNKTRAVALSEDGQTNKTVSISGGYAGHTVWSCEGADGIAVLAGDQDLSAKKNSIKFNTLRPGEFTVSFSLDFDETMTDTAVVTITGVAVETQDGARGKTYLTRTAEQESPTVQLTAYCEQGKRVSSWSSGNEAVATVDGNGLVTAQGVGTALITATDSAGQTGGIKVVVQDGETPYFENIQFLTSALTGWTEESFSATRLEYDLTIRTYSTSILTLQNTTLYDTEKYTATAEYTDINGQPQCVPVNSGALTKLPDIPFGSSVVTITLSDKGNSDNKTVYTFHVTRPRDTTKAIKYNGITLVPDGRDLLATKYNGYAEGTMLKADEDGTLTSGTGVSGTQYYYRAYALDGLERFSLTFTGNTAYTRLRWSTDGGESWTELPQGGGTTGPISFPAEGKKLVKIQVQLLDDASYSVNTAAGKDGFAEGELVAYTVWVEQVPASGVSAQILTAVTDGGDWYPAFDKDRSSFSVVIEGSAELPVLTYTVSENATVKLGSSEQTPDEDGAYTLALKTSAQSLTVTSADGTISNTYSFKVQKKSGMYDVPDKVVDYLCINSQYTNGGYGLQPELTLSASLKSLGNFGGYITYYYEKPLVDDPRNKYGVDFYVYGNANVDTSTATKMSFFEPGQVWVSEDGETWYALAGSAHYEDGVDWNYTVTYTKNASGKTAWADSQGNRHDGASYSGAYPAEGNYPLHSFSGDSITLSGILLPAANGETAPLGTSVDAYAVNWGYADAFANGAMGEDVDPYLDNSGHAHKTNGFDLAWAVDGDGLPVDVSDMKFHYVKVQTASNIWHPSFGEKSTEVTAVVRTTPQEQEVGVTDAPAGVTISDGVSSRAISLIDGQQVYDVDLGDMKYVSVSVNGAAGADNIYINNQRISAGGAASGIRVTEEAPRLVRIIIQNGEKEPRLYLLRLTSSADASSDLVEGVKINVNGVARPAETTDGETYTASVGYRIGSVGILPIAAADVTVTINGQPVQDAYTLHEGENSFTITGTREGVSDTITLKIVREAAPETTGTITVYFTLRGDSAHGDDGQVHTLKNGGLETWIPQTAYEVDAPAVVLDVFEAAVEGKYDYVNADGNYISSINGLAEFTNGPLSGWMYTLNGSHPDMGVAEQTVKNGDRIVFHYTDDYTKEQGSEQWSGGAPVSSDEDSGSVLEPEAVADKDGNAVVSVTNKELNTVIQSAGKSGAESIVIAPKVEEDATSLAVTLPKGSVSSIVSGTEAGLTIRSGLGTVELPREALSAISGAAKGGEVTVTIAAGQTGDAETLLKDQPVAPADLKDASVTSVTIASGKTSITSFGGNRITLTLPVDGKIFEAGRSYTVYQISDDGTVETHTGTCVTVNGKRFVRITVEHLSSFVVLPGAVREFDFDDVRESDWFYEAAKYVFDRGLMDGTGEKTFSPQTEMTRAMLVTVFWRMEGEPEVTAADEFIDVEPGTWYADAVLWADVHGIVNGVGGGQFAPADHISREQLATMLYRYARYKEQDTSARAGLSGYADGGAVSAWALEAMEWACGKELITGKNGDRLAPQDTATRAEVATLLMRYLQTDAE